MNAAEQEAILFIALRAAFADGARTSASAPRSGASPTRCPASSTSPPSTRMRCWAPDARAGRRRAAGAGAAPVRLRDGGLRVRRRRRAFGAEKAFLDELRAALGLDAARGEAFAAQAAAVASAPLGPGSPSSPPYAATMTGAEMDKMILNYAILNGALELLPQNLASMAIIPLQMKMVYRIGKAHGFELDRGHVKDFLADRWAWASRRSTSSSSAASSWAGCSARSRGGLGRRAGLGRHGRGILVRLHLRPRAGGEALLRRRPRRSPPTCCGRRFPRRSARRGPAVEVPARDRAARAHARRRRGVRSVRA